MRQFENLKKENQISFDSVELVNLFNSFQTFTYRVRQKTPENINFNSNVRLFDSL